MKSKIRFSILASLFSLTLLSTSSAQTYGGYWAPGAHSGTAYTIPGSPVMMGSNKAPQYPAYTPSGNWQQGRTMTSNPPVPNAPAAPPTPPPPPIVKQVRVQGNPAQP